MHPDDLAHEFSLARQMVRNWIKQHELDSGSRSDGLTPRRREMKMHAICADVLRCTY